MSKFEKRKYAREEVFNKVLINGEAFGYINDISLGGLKISIMKIEPVDFDKTVNIRILSKQAIGDNIEIICEIRWQKDEGMFRGYGLEFINLTVDEQGLIQKYIDYIQSFESDENGITVEITEMNDA